MSRFAALRVTSRRFVLFFRREVLQEGIYQDSSLLLLADSLKGTVLSSMIYGTPGGLVFRVRRGFGHLSGADRTVASRNDVTAESPLFAIVLTKNNSRWMLPRSGFVQWAITVDIGTLPLCGGNIKERNLMNWPCVSIANAGRHVGIDHVTGVSQDWSGLLDEVFFVPPIRSA